MDKPQILIHAEKAVKYTANGCNWLPKSKRLITYGSHANRSGALEVYDLDNGKLVLMQEVSGLVCLSHSVRALPLASHLDMEGSRRLATRRSVVLTGTCSVCVFVCVGDQGKRDSVWDCKPFVSESPQPSNRRCRWKHDELGRRAAWRRPCVPVQGP